MVVRDSNSFGSTRNALLIALSLNTLVCLVEFVAGYHGNSLALLLDAFHNCSDEIALVLLAIGCTKFQGRSRALEFGANSLNTAGIALTAASIVYFSIGRMLEPIPVAGGLTMGAALIAAAGNQLVVLSLRESAKHSAAIGLAYLHNIGDVAMCLSIALSGATIHFTGLVWLDPLLAFAVASYLVISTIKELARSRGSFFNRTPERA